MVDQLARISSKKKGYTPFYSDVAKVCKVMWLLALLLPVWQTRSEFSGTSETVYGMVPALMGWFGLFIYCPAWLANLVLFPLAKSWNERIEEFWLSATAFAIAASSYMISAIYDDTGAQIIIARYIGFYLWLASFYVLVVGHAVLANRANPRLSIIRWLIVIVLIVAVAFLEWYFPVRR